MVVQIIVLLLCLLGYSIFREHGSYLTRLKIRKKYIIFIMIIFTLQSGLRSTNIGADTGVYKSWFYETGIESWSILFERFQLWLNENEGKDPGYEILQKTFYTILPSYQMFLIGIATLFFTGLGKLFYYHLTSNREILVASALYQALFYSFMSITGHRQTIAIGIILLSLPYILNKKYLKSLFFLLVAITIHKSSILFLFFYILPYIKKYKLVLICSFALYPIMTIFGVSFAKYLMFESERMSQYSNYLIEYEGAGAYSFAFFIITLGICTLWKNKEIIKRNKYNYIFISCIALSIALTPFTMINPSNMRIVQYFSIFSIIILPSYLSSLQTTSAAFKNIHIYVFIFFFIFCMLARGTKYEFFWEI